MKDDPQPSFNPSQEIRRDLENWLSDERDLEKTILPHLSTSHEIVFDGGAAFVIPIVDEGTNGEVHGSGKSDG